MVSGITTLGDPHRDRPQGQAEMEQGPQQSTTIWYQVLILATVSSTSKTPSNDTLNYSGLRTTVGVLQNQ